jgi:hypothetical protein
MRAMLRPFTRQRWRPSFLELHSNRAAATGWISIDPLEWGLDGSFKSAV